jgi:hypothetical protein
MLRLLRVQKYRRKSRLTVFGGAAMPSMQPSLHQPSSV